MASSAFTDGILPMLFNYEDAFLRPEGINRIAQGTKLLLTAVLLIVSLYVTYGRHGTIIWVQMVALTRLQLPTLVGLVLNVVYTL